MKLKQAIVTSCMQGIEGKSGKCLYSKSKELSFTSQSRFENSSVYQKNYKYQGELEKLPVRFIAGKDETGAFYLQQIRSILDYGAYGRTGNVLSQMFLLEKEQKMLPYPPICYYQASGFIKQMEQEQVSSYRRPDYLPEIDNLEPNKSLSFEKVCRFVNENGMDEFLKLLGGVIEAKRNHQRVIIFDGPARIVYWIAAIQYCLPSSINREISFSTYTYDLQVAQENICGFIRGISNDREEMSMEDIIFDWKNKVFPIVDVQNSWFANIKMAYLIREYKNIEAFNKFLEKRDFSLIGQELFWAYEVFSVLEGGALGNYAKTEEVIRFVKKWLDNTEKGAFIVSIWSNNERCREFGSYLNTSCVQMLADCSIDMALQCLRDIEGKCEFTKEGENSREIEELWKAYLELAGSKNFTDKKILKEKLETDLAHYFMFMYVELKAISDADNLKIFSSYYEAMLKNRSSIENKIICVKGYITAIINNRKYLEGIQAICELLHYLLFKTNNTEREIIDVIVEELKEKFPYMNKNITIRSFQKRRGKENDNIELYEVAAVIRRHQRYPRSSVYCDRAELFWLGCHVLNETRKNKNYCFIKDKELKDISKNRINIKFLLKKEVIEYFEWIRPGIDHKKWGNDFGEVVCAIMSWFIMGKEQLVGITEFIINWLESDGVLDTNKGKMAVKKILDIYENQGSEQLDDMLINILNKLKKKWYEHFDSWMKEIQSDEDSCYDYWEQIRPQLSQSNSRRFPWRH